MILSPLPVQILLRIVNGGGSVGYGGDDLAEGLDADVSHSENTGDRGAGGLVGFDIAVIIYTGLLEQDGGFPRGS